MAAPKKWKDLRCSIERPVVEEHELNPGKWWMVNLYSIDKEGNRTGTMSGHGFSTKADAENAIALARSLEIHGYVSRSHTHKLMHRDV